MIDGKEPTFFVREIPIYGDTILAPMAGYSDVPYRAVCRSFGSAMHYSEFVAVEVLQGKPNGNWKLLDRGENEFPFTVQIFGNDPQKLLRAALNIEEKLQPDIIDINMGCSTKKVSGRGAGVGMMRTPEKIEETFRLLNEHLTIPFTGKYRLGWNDLINYLDIAKMLEDNGCSLLALHGRTKEQKYGDFANWDAIAELKSAVSMPVIGNGDIVQPNDIDRMLDHTGCDAVMIGRGAIGNPCIFDRRARYELTFPEISDLIRVHLRENVAYYGERLGIRLLRKHVNKYLAGIEPVHALRRLLFQVNDVESFLELMEEVDEKMINRAGEVGANDEIDLRFEEDCSVNKRHLIMPV